MINRQTRQTGNRLTNGLTDEVRRKERLIDRQADRNISKLTGNEIGTDRQTHQAPERKTRIAKWGRKEERR